MKLRDEEVIDHRYIGSFVGGFSMVGTRGDEDRDTDADDVGDDALSLGSDDWHGR